MVVYKVKWKSTATQHAEMMRKKGYKTKVYKRKKGYAVSVTRKK